MYRLEHGDQRGSRLWIPLVCGLVVLGGGLLVKVAFGSAGPVPDAARNPSPSPLASQRSVEPGPPPGRSFAQPSRASLTRTASEAKAAAGAEIARRIDIEVSPRAAAALREGRVDGRVLIVLASLASADMLTAVDLPPGGSVEAADLEMGVVDVEHVLDWLAGQRRLRPDRVEVRREASVAYLLLIHTSPEPPGLFPS